VGFSEAAADAIGVPCYAGQRNFHDVGKCLPQYFVENRPASRHTS
jgi:membrane-associated HD superfamily phosphohydrolase